MKRIVVVVGGVAVVVGGIVVIDWQSVNCNPVEGNIAMTRMEG